MDIWRGHELGYMPLMLFLGEEGYSPLTGMFHQDAGISTPLWINNQSGEIYPFFNMPAAVDAFTRLVEWINLGLIEIWDGEYSPGNRFPIILYDSALLGLIQSNISYDEYTAVILPGASTIMADFYGVGGGAVATPGTDTRVFFEFLEWLTFPENHRNFVYGIEGVDYISDNDGYLIDWLDTVYSNWLGSFLFINNIMERQIVHPSQFLLDYYEKIDNVPEPVFPLQTNDRLSIGHALATDTVYSQAVTAKALRMNLLYQQLFSGSVEADAARTIIEDAFNEISNIIGIDSAERLVRQIMPSMAGD